MYLEAYLGDTGGDAWVAVQKKGKERDYGTTKSDIDAYAGTGGAVVAAAACAASEVGAAATTLCAAGGAIIASFVADTIQTIGAGLFGDGDPQQQPNDVWNPVADSAVRGIVKALRIKKGLDVDNPPGGSFRNYPEWDGVAAAWASHANAVVASKGGTVKWFYDSPSDKDPGRIRQAAIDQWATVCDQPWKSAWQHYIAWKGVPPTIDDFPACKAMIGPVPEAMVRATQQTMVEVVSGRSSGGASSRTSTVVKLGALAGAGVAVWYFRQPLLALASRLIRR